MQKCNYLLPLGLLLLASCSQPASKPKSPSGGYGRIMAVNHTKWAINSFSVDGQSGLDIISPYQYGGGGCCYGVPAKWRPGIMVQVDWETGSAFSTDFPGYSDTAKYKAWEKKIIAQSRQHRKIVPLPDYSGHETCGITVHFLPCDEIKVTTSCWSPDHENYPIKLPLRMKEPKVCPQ